MELTPELILLLDNLTTLNQFNVMMISRPLDCNLDIHMYFFEEGIQVLIVDDDCEILNTYVKDNGETEWAAFP